MTRAHVLFISAVHSLQRVFVGLNVRVHLYWNTHRGADTESGGHWYFLCSQRVSRREGDRPSPPVCQGQWAPPTPPQLCAGRWLLTFGVPVTQGRRPHVAQPDCPFAAAVHEGVAVMGVELGRRNHLRELLHVGRFNVHDVWNRESRSRRERRQHLMQLCEHVPHCTDFHFSFYNGLHKTHPLLTK